MELVLPIHNVHPYFSLKNVGKKLHITHGEIQYLVCAPCQGTSLSRPRPLSPWNLHSGNRQQTINIVNGSSTC